MLGSNLVRMQMLSPAEVLPKTKTTHCLAVRSHSPSSSSSSSLSSPPRFPYDLTVSMYVRNSA